MKIGFVGYGNMAQELSRRWATTHEVFIGGRNTSSAADLAEEIHASGSGTTADAVRFGDVIVLATPANAVENAIESAGGAERFAGKVLVDINNPVNVPGGPHDNPGAHYLPRLFDEGSLAEHIAGLVPDCHVVKAFNMCQASVWAMDPPIFDGRKLTALYCGDDAAAKAKIAELIGELGCEPVDVGALRYARLLEASAAIVIKFLFAGRDARTVLNLIQPESKPL